MAVRANVTIALRSGNQTEPDVFLQGEDRYESNAVIQTIILDAVRDMEEYDWIAFCVIPADFSATGVPTPLAYQGEKPCHDTLDEMGFDMVGYLGRCASAHEGSRCTDYLGHEGGDEPMHIDEQGQTWYDEAYAARILGG